MSQHHSASHRAVKAAGSHAHTAADGTPIERLLRRLEAGGLDPRPLGSGQWESRCPGHQGTRRNLSIREGDDGTALLNCHHSEEGGGGCKLAAILEPLGLAARDLFPTTFGPRPGGGGRGKAKGKNRPQAGKGAAGPAGGPALFDSPRAAAAWMARKHGNPAGHWVYETAEGTPIFAVYRFEGPTGKTYRPVAAVAGGRWKLGDPDGPLPLYKLAGVLAADQLFLVEGEKAADVVAGLGLAATTTAHGAKAPQKTDVSPLAGKKVVIIPDHDAAGESYAKALVELLAELEPAPEVRILRLADLVREGEDVAEWVAMRAGRSSEELRAELLDLADAAEVIGQAAGGGEGVQLRVIGGEPDEPGEVKPNEAADDPSRLARLFIEEQCQHAEGLTLRYWQGEFWAWDGAYHPVPIDDIRARLHVAVKSEFDRLNVGEVVSHGADPLQGGDELGSGKKGPPKAKKVTTALVSNAALALGGYTRLEPRTKAPSWLEGPAPFPAEDVLPTRNSLVSLPRLVAGKGDACWPPTPRYFAHYALDYDFSAEAPRPTEWAGFLDQLWPGDADSRGLLQEWMGYLLTPDTSQQKILMMIGPKRSGKGTIARIMKGLIGAENVANPTLAGLATNFGLAPLIGKPAAIITDARLSGRADISQIVERLLSISGEDDHTVDRKHKPAVTVKLPTRFMLISNELPKLPDASNALASRMMLLSLRNSFFGQEDPRLTGRLLGELPGILLWAIEGWKRLRERGRFVQPAAGQELIEQLEDLSSPVGAFVRGECRIEPGAETPVKELYTAWQRWCGERGKDHAGDEMRFGRDLRATLPNLSIGQRRIEGGGRIRVYEGIRILGNWENS